MKLKGGHIFIIYLFIVTLITLGISFSRFSTTLTNSGAENTTPPDIEFSTWVLDHEAASVSLKNMVPGDSRNIAIWVKNWEDGEPIKISGYNQSFTLELQTTGNLPLKYTLEENSEGSVELNRPDSSYRYISENQTFIANTPDEKEYILTVSWPIEIKDYRYRNEIDYIEIRLKAMQL